MSKLSDLNRTSNLKPTDIFLISQFINDNEYRSCVASLDTLKDFIGEGAKTILNDVDLNQITRPGIYTLTGVADSAAATSLHYPSFFGHNSEVLMIVSSVPASGSNHYVTQTVLYADENGVFPKSRAYNSSLSHWTDWYTPLASSDFEKKGMKQINISQSGSDLSTVVDTTTGAATRFDAPDGTSGRPNPKTSPTTKAGQRFSFVDPYAQKVEGTYRGNVFISDEDGRVYTNVDKTPVTDPDNPVGVNWRELITVEMKSKKAISKPSSNDSGMSTTDVVGKIVQVLRDNNMLLPGDEPISAVKAFDAPLDLTTQPGGSSVEVKVTPFYGSAYLYIRSKDVTIAQVPDSLQIQSITTETGPDDKPIIYGVITLPVNQSETFTPAVGTTSVEFSGTSDFATILATLTVNVTAPAP